MNEGIRKPLSVARMDFMEELANLINNSPVPMFVIEDVIGDVYSQVKKVAQQQYEQDRQRYEESIANSNNIESAFDKNSDKDK